MSPHPEMDANRYRHNYGTISESMADFAVHLPHIVPTILESRESWPNYAIIHSPQISATNFVRDILLKYHLSNRARRAFVYRMTSSALKFIREVERKAKHHREAMLRRQSTAATVQTVRKGSAEAAARAADVLAEEGGEVSWDASQDGHQRDPTRDDLTVDCEPDFGMPDVWENEPNFLVQMIRPQISMHSSREADSRIVMAAYRVNGKVYAVTDPKFRNDEINSNVMHRTLGQLDSLQIFCPKEDGDDFVPLEVAVDLKLDPTGFDRIVPKVNAQLRYDKFNKLRISQGHHQAPRDMTALAKGKNGAELSIVEEHIRTATDAILFSADKPSITANPDQYAAIYTVATDLLLYTDPAQKQTSERLDRDVLIGDAGGLAGRTDQVAQQQHVVRQEWDVLLDWQDAHQRLHRSELESYYDHQARLQSSVEDLNFTVELITALQNANTLGSAAASKSSPGHVIRAKAREVVWHVRDAKDAPLVKLAVNGARLDWNSHTNATVTAKMVIDDLQALSMKPDAIFTEILAKLEHDAHVSAKVRARPFVSFTWDQLAPVGGISVIEKFAASIHPVRLQIEHQTGKALYEYFLQDRVTKRQPKNDKSNGGKSDKKEELRPRLPSGHSELAAMGHSPGQSNDHLSAAGTPSTRRSLYSNREGQTSNSSLQPPEQSGSRRPSSVHSVQSSNPQTSLRRQASLPALREKTIRADDQLDAAEMLRRANVHRSFIFIDIAPTTIQLSYEGKKLAQITNFAFSAPQFVRRSVIWTTGQFSETYVKEMGRALFKQSGQLVAAWMGANRRIANLQKRARQQMLPMKKAAKLSRNYLGVTRERSVSPVGQTNGSSTNNRMLATVGTGVVGDERTLHENSEEDEEQDEDAEIDAYLEEIRDRTDPSNRHRTPQVADEIVDEPEAMDDSDGHDDPIDQDESNDQEEESRVSYDSTHADSISTGASLRSKSLGLAKRMLTPLQINKTASSSQAVHSPPTASAQPISDIEKSELLLGPRVSRQ